jgi:hypothetical protein
MRFGRAIPFCEPGMGYSMEHGRCIQAQHIGGIIPCSADDNHFDSRSGRWVPNCQ